MKVWIWYICLNRIENYYHHDEEQLGFYKKVHIKTQSMSKTKDVLAILHRKKRMSCNLFHKNSTQENVQLHLQHGESWLGEFVYPKCHFVFSINWNMKLETKFLFSFLYWSWDKKHQNKWFFDFPNNWTLKFKFEVCFSFFILISKTKNQIYSNKYLMTSVYLTFIQISFCLKMNWKLPNFNFYLFFNFQFPFLTDIA